MLAKEVKIETLIRQRIFIEEELRKTKYRKEGDPSWRYMGKIYLENLKYFRTQGYSIQTIEVAEGPESILGITVYCFSPGEDIQLTEGEIAESQLSAVLENGEYFDEEEELERFGFDVYH